MSVTAIFIQLSPRELAALQADPSRAEPLFRAAASAAPTATPLPPEAEERIRTAGPQLFAGAREHLDPATRRQLEERLGESASALAAGAGGDVLVRLMEERQARTTAPAPPAGGGPVLSMDEDWHGMHYVLCGQVEPGTDPMSRPVLGGRRLGAGGDGFSGYGPPRYFTAPEVAELSRALSRRQLEAEAAARFDAGRMSGLRIFGDWQPSDAARVMDSFRRLRDFYADAASEGRAIVTCLV